MLKIAHSALFSSSPFDFGNILAYGKNKPEDMDMSFEVIKNGERISLLDFCGSKRTYGIKCGNYLALYHYIFMGASLNKIEGPGYSGPFRYRHIHEDARAYNVKDNEKRYLLYDKRKIEKGYYMARYGHLTHKGCTTRYYRVSYCDQTGLANFQHLDYKSVVTIFWHSNLDNYNTNTQMTRHPKPGNPWFYGAPVVDAGKRIRVRKPI